MLLCVSVGPSATTQARRAVKAVMWFLTAGLDHCKAVPRTKRGGGYSPARGTHTKNVELQEQMKGY